MFLKADMPGLQASGTPTWFNCGVMLLYDVPNVVWHHISEAFPMTSPEWQQSLYVHAHGLNGALTGLQVTHTKPPS